MTSKGDVSIGLRVHLRSKPGGLDRTQITVGLIRLGIDVIKDKDSVLVGLLSQLSRFTLLVKRAFVYGPCVFEYTANTYLLILLVSCIDSFLTVILSKELACRIYRL